MGQIDGERPWDAQDVTPALTIPALPWSPGFEGSGARSWPWVSILISWPLGLAYCAVTAVPWWLTLGTLFYLWPLYAELRGPCDQLTVTAVGFEIRGVLRKRAFPWSAIERLQVRRYEISVGLGCYGREIWRFDGQHGRPSALEVAAVLERLRLEGRSTATPRRTTPSWGAAVLLAGTTASIAAAVVGLINDLV
ncbi:hypothetical protein GCM10009789_38720 [Kribbella sancticallisti]|uniref:PH domain-containing protein n=1 Tax=Kribbella sancticallisti TaxID=460087 RepID=A0ABN2DN93_9ACTN